MEYLYFLFEVFTIIVAILVCFAGFLMLIAGSKSKGAKDGDLVITSLKEDLDKRRDEMEEKVLSSCELKEVKKARKLEKKEKDKKEKKENKSKKSSKSKSKDRAAKVFVIKFQGDIQASAVSSLREQISAICQIAKKQDEVICCIESGGGAVHAYGLAASQLIRLKTIGLKLTVVVDKVAASGGYLMAAVADDLVCAPFSIIGSIGVLMQLPNFHKVLDKNGVEFEQITSGEHKRTITMFGKNTPADRKKVTEEISQVHKLFKDAVKKYRPGLDLKKVATGEYWLGSDALGLKLVDRLGTSDEEIFKAYQDEKEIFELTYQQKQSMLDKILGKKANVSKAILDLAKNPSNLQAEFLS
jgi:serine protease SohB